MNQLTAILLSAFLVACGGGGSDGGGGGGPIPADPIAAAAQQVLTDCIDLPVSAIIDVIETVRAFPGSAAPPIQIGNPGATGIPFSADPGAGAPIPTLLGRITFEDAAGQEFMPFTQQDLMNDINNLLTGIAGLPNGTKVSIIIDPVPAAGIETATLSQVMQGGLPVDVSGSLVHDSGTCRTTISFAGETILSLLGVYPNMTADVEVTEGTDSLVGQIFFSGQSTAIVEISINGTGPFQFDLDLDTGAVSPSS
ncbi:MAG: hypothetical protein ACYS0E_05945 [Planctomycetota bacterium]